MTTLKTGLRICNWRSSTNLIITTTSNEWRITKKFRFTKHIFKRWQNLIFNVIWWSLFASQAVQTVQTNKQTDRQTVKVKEIKIRVTKSEKWNKIRITKFKQKSNSSYNYKKKIEIKITLPTRDKIILQFAFCFCTVQIKDFWATLKSPGVM